MSNGNWAKVNDITLDTINEFKRQLEEIIVKNKKLKSSRNHSMAAIKDFRHRIEIEQQLIAEIDKKVDKNMQEYYAISDKMRKILKS